MSEFADSLEALFAEAGADESTAAEAAERIAAFREDYDEDLGAEDVEERLAESPYDEFTHAYDWLVGDLAAANEDCTDSREYRLSGFDSLSANPEQGA